MQNLGCGGEVGSITLMCLGSNLTQELTRHVRLQFRGGVICILDNILEIALSWIRSGQGQRCTDVTVRTLRPISRINKVWGKKRQQYTEARFPTQRINHERTCKSTTDAILQQNHWRSKLMNCLPATISAIMDTCTSPYKSNAIPATSQLTSK